MQVRRLLDCRPGLRYYETSAEKPVQTRKEYDMSLLHAGTPPTRVDPTRSLPIPGVPRARSTA